MKKKQLLLTAAAALMLLCGCGNNGQTASTEAAGNTGTTVASESEAPRTEATEAEVTEGDTTEEKTSEKDTGTATEGPAEVSLADGLYLARFDTDGSMFHVNETCDGRGILTVSGGKMTIHLVMPSKNTVNLFFGLAEDAKKDGAQLINPTLEKVTYSDGMTEEVNAFDVPVPVLDQEYDVALVGTKGKWYDHKVKVSDPVPYDPEQGTKEDPEEATSEATSEKTSEASSVSPADGEYTIEASVEGGSGRAGITSPAALMVKDGKMVIRLEWSSPNYDYMIVDGEKYLPVNKEGNSQFEIPIPGLDKDITVIADTTAMSKPHEIEYVLHLQPETLTKGN